MYFVMHTVVSPGIIKGRKKMMTDEQIEIFIAEMKDAMCDAQEEFGVSKIEIYSTALAVALGGIREEAIKTGDLDQVEKDLERIGIIFREVEDAFFDDELDIPPNKTIH